MLRNVGATIAGLVVGGVVNMALLQLNMAFFPAPPGMSLEDPEQLKAFIATMPLAGYILIFGAHLGQAGVGGFLAARLGSSAPVVLALIVGALTALGTVINQQMLQAPLWTLIELPLDLALAWAAGRWVQQQRSKQS